MHMLSFADFWPDYVRAHSRERTRVLHAIGSVRQDDRVKKDSGHRFHRDIDFDRLSGQ